MDRKHCPCALASSSEEELTTVPGPRPGTAIRLRVQHGADGFVRLEQMAYGPGMGWYVQKSFCIPGELLAAVITELRKADCLLPRQRRDPHRPLLRIGPDTPPPREAERRSG